MKKGGKFYNFIKYGDNMKIIKTKNKLKNNTNKIDEIAIIYQLLEEYKNIYNKDCEDILVKINKHLNKEKSAIQKEDLLYDMTDYQINFLISLSTKKIITLNNSMKKYNKSDLQILLKTNCQEYYKKEIIKYTLLNKMFLKYILTKDNKQNSLSLENYVKLLKYKKNNNNKINVKKYLFKY